LLEPHPKVVHGRPFHPESQGAVEALHKEKEESTLKKGLNLKIFI